MDPDQQERWTPASDYEGIVTNIRGIMSDLRAERIDEKQALLLIEAALRGTGRLGAGL